MEKKYVILLTILTILIIAAVAYCLSATLNMQQSIGIGERTTGIATTGNIRVKRTVSLNRTNRVLNTEGSSRVYTTPTIITGMSTPSKLTKITSARLTTTGPTTLTRSRDREDTCDTCGQPSNQTIRTSTNQEDFGSDSEQ